LTKNGILIPLLFIALLTVQYSSARTLIPISKKLEVPDIDIDESAETGEREPDVEVEEEPTVKGEDASGPVEEGPVVQEEPVGEEVNETSSEEPKGPSPKKGVGGGLDIANATQQLLPPAYQIKITFDAIKVKSLGNLQKCGQWPPAEWDIGVYVQGKLIKLDDMGQPLKVCKDMVVQLKDAEATVDIPGESVESPKDYQPLSIFTAGSQLDNCNPKPLPAELPEVRKILSDKGSTRPYYANAEEKIQNIQDQVSNGCIPKTYTTIGVCQLYTGCPETYYYNHTLKDLQLLEESPGYGKYVPKDTVGNPASVQIDTCEVYRTGSFCLYYTIYCPLCPSIRVH
jgi:hypothetical protein